MAKLYFIDKLKQKMAEIGYLSLRDTAKELGVSAPAVLYWLRKLDNDDVVPVSVRGVTVYFIPLTLRKKIDRMIRKRRNG